MTRDEILNLKVGDMVQHIINGKAMPPSPVVEIYAQEISQYHGRAYVCFYQQFGENATISGSISEGEDFYRIIEQEND